MAADSKEPLSTGHSGYRLQSSTTCCPQLPKDTVGSRPLQALPRMLCLELPSNLFSSSAQPADQLHHRRGFRGMPAARSRSALPAASALLFPEFTLESGGYELASQILVKILLFFI